MKESFVIGVLMGLMTGACIVSSNKDVEKVVKKGKKAVAEVLEK